MTAGAREAVRTLLARYGHHRWLATVSVGVEGGREHLIVHATDDRKARRSLPHIWAGLEVRVGRLGIRRE
jgi:hypothetical protein